jgi:spore maturation protein CgeB
MRILMFYHSLVSDWNHGNAHFLRGIVAELLDRGHEVRVQEPRDGWSRANLLRDHGSDALAGFRRAYPQLQSETYDPTDIDVDALLHEADLVLVHEWNPHDLVARLGAARSKHPGCRLLFHDTHHRSITDPASMSAYDLSGYDGVLAFGDAIRDLYIERGWAAAAWTWHEAADTRIFYPRVPADPQGDVVWIGNWGDEERTTELEEFLINPIRELGLKATLYGVRYPESARRALERDGIAYGGWLPNHDVPEVFARHLVTIHVPRRPYVESLHGVPTIRPFEALACGIPMISARWHQSGDLFTPDLDFLVARDGADMAAHLRDLVANPERRRQLAAHGLATVRRRHTCGHRVDELLAIVDRIPSCLVETL